MKTLTTLTAAAALIAGLSLANAADSSSMNKDKTMGAGSMNKQVQVIGTSKYCVKTKSGTLNCTYASLSACRSDAKGAACTANPHTGTTGAGGTMK